MKNYEKMTKAELLGEISTLLAEKGASLNGEAPVAADIPGGQGQHPREAPQPVHDEMRERARQAEIHLERQSQLVQVSQEVLAETTLVDVLQKITDAARELTNGRYAIAGLCHRDGSFQVGSSSRSDGEVPMPPENTFCDKQGEFYLRLIEKENSVRFTDRELRNHPESSVLSNGHLHLRGLLGARLIDKIGQPLGIVMVTDKGDGGEFTQEDEGILLQLAALASLGIEHIAAREEASRWAETLITQVRVLESMAEGVVMSDENGVITYANPAFVQMFGYEAEELIGRFVGAINASPLPETRRMFQDIRDHLEKTGVWAGEFHNRRKDGVTFYTSARISALDVSGKRHLISVQEDITKRRQVAEALNKAHAELELRIMERTAKLATMVNALEREIAERKHAEESLRAETAQRLRAMEELREKERILMQQSRMAAMGEMIGNIAHQWRQPLNTLGLVIQRLPFFYETGEFSKEFLENSTSEAMRLIQHMSRTIDDFRDFFKTDKEKVSFAVNRVIRQTVSLIEGGFRDDNIAIILNCEDNPHIFGYPNEYSQVLLSILNNARDVFAERRPDKARVTISSRLENNAMVVTISDNAGGITEDVMERIFDPYFTTKGPDKGTGIGLFIAKTIIENSMGGRLTVHNTGDGAEFRIEV